MEENTKNEIMKGAEVLGLSQEDAMTKFAELCQENGIEETNPIGLGLWRNYVANAKRSQKSGNQTNDSYYRAAFGFFVSLDAPRDMMSWNRNKAKEEYLRDEDNALQNGIVAVANQNYSSEIEHPATFPQQLVWLIINSTVYLPFVGKQYSPTVLDPFAGALGTYKGIQWFNSNFDCNIQFVGYDLKCWFDAG